MTLTGARTYPFSFLFMTNRVDLALEAEASGVDWVFVDLEKLGKAERQRGRNTILSDHVIDDVVRLRSELTSAQLLVRINPTNPLTRDEVAAAIDAGADAVMLPMLTTPEEVERFVGFVDARAKTWLLVETAAAVVRSDEILRVPGIDRVHVGLNDLHLSLGLNFMHESLAAGLVDHVAERTKRLAPGALFGFGGGARISDQHPVPPSDILREHVRLESHAIILSRTFHKDAASRDELRRRMNLAEEIQQIRATLDQAAARTDPEMEDDRQRIREAIWRVARSQRG